MFKPLILSYQSNSYHGVVETDTSRLSYTTEREGLPYTGVLVVRLSG